MTIESLTSTGPAPGGLNRRPLPVIKGASAAGAADREDVQTAEQSPSVAAAKGQDQPDRIAPVKPGGGSAVAAQVIAHRESKAEESGAFELSEEEKAIVASLQARDREVRAHEAAHAAAGGSYASAPQFEYESGPDGRQYAVSGHVTIDTSPVSGDPEATIRKMETVRRAALAPAQPSGQDRAVAQAAEASARAASAELSASRTNKTAEPGDEDATSDSGAGITASAPSQTEFGPDPVTPAFAAEAFQATVGATLAFGGDTHAGHAHASYFA